MNEKNEKQGKKAGKTSLCIKQIIPSLLSSLITLCKAQAYDVGGGGHGVD